MILYVVLLIDGSANDNMDDNQCDVAQKMYANEYVQMDRPKSVVTHNENALNERKLVCDESDELVRMRYDHLMRYATPKTMIATDSLMKM